MELHYTFPLRECYGFGSRYGNIIRDGKPYFHGGQDLCVWEDDKTDLIAVKSGKIVASYDVGKDGYNGGNIIALEVQYGEMKQWILYQHCRNTVPLRSVKQGEAIGTVGNTGASEATHLHITFCQPVDKNMAFSYHYAINHTINPVPHIMYRLKGIEYKFNDKPHAGGSGSEDLKKIVEFTNIEPVERNTAENQIFIAEGSLYLRTDHSRKSQDLGFAPIGYYNVFDTYTDSEYTWYRIDDNIWVAGVNYVTYYPKEQQIDYKYLYEETEKALHIVKDNLENLVKDLGEFLK